jgi:UDP-glucose 4-epimerase
VLTWIVGAGGLLGGAVARTVGPRFIGAAAPWDDTERATQVLDADLTRFIEAAGPDDWTIVWAAGAGVVGTSNEALSSETRVIECFLTSVRQRHPAGRGSVFLASSAGGVYAGSSEPPFTETSTPRPLSVYGEAKIAQEELLVKLLAGTVPVLIGRFSNLVGPGQNLAKPQGLVSQLCRAAAITQSVNLFVPMETLRDYLYVDDAAAMVLEMVTRAVREQPEQPVLRNLSSQRPVSVAAVLRTVQHVARRGVRVALGTSPASRFQVRDLRIATHFAGDIRDVEITPFPVAVKQVYEDILQRVRHPSDSAAPLAT